MLTAEVLPVLFAEHRGTCHYSSYSVITMLRKFGSEHVKRLVADYGARERDPGFQVRFGHPEFDVTVRATLADPVRGDAWPLLRDALTMWRPLSDDHIAPIALLADPRAARLITPERGREILSMRRG